jgi:short-subunit dehydrogenase
MTGSAFVTGASSGIGAAFVERFAADGIDVILIARRRERLEAAAARLRAEAGISATVLVADLTDAADLARVEQAIGEQQDLAFLVNNAGVAGYMPFIQLPPEQAASMIALHVTATTRLTRAALPGMIARGSGAIINVSSGLAFSASLPAPPLPFRAVYAGAKAYINAFSEIVAAEVAGTGVRVQALCPGLVRTELHEVAGVDVSHAPTIMEPEDVVSAALAGLTLGEAVCIPALDDPALLATFAEARTAVLASVRRGVVAERYHELPG